MPRIFRVCIILLHIFPIIGNIFFSGKVFYFFLFKIQENQSRRFLNLFLIIC